MNDPLFAAGIAILSSLGIAIVGYLYQIHRDKEQRKWYIDDRKYQRRIEVLNNRLKDAENYVNEIYEMAKKLFRYENQLIFGITSKQFVDEAALAHLIEIVTRKAYADNLGDEDFTKLMQDYIKLIDDEYKLADDLQNNISQKMTIDSNAENMRVRKFIFGVSSKRAFLLKRIDHLSGFQT